MAKHIFVFGGVLSSLGKGIASASIGFIFKQMGYRVIIQKLDPYLNVDPGTMSPYQHGEVFVTCDGAETDLDLGHYERFLDQELTQSENITSGKIYYKVISKEREGRYLGETVQVIPHITDEIKAYIKKNEVGYDIVITEVGGTVGDIESFQFLEAIRQFKIESKSTDCISILLTYVPVVKSAGELKTKPTQHAAIKLREIGIQPDVLMCRSELPFGSEIKDKIALFTNVKPQNVINAIDVDSIYEVPLSFYKQFIHRIICKHLKIEQKSVDLTTWKKFLQRVKHPSTSVKIAVCGKYVEHQDAYKSIVEAFIHAGAQNDVFVQIKWVDTQTFFTRKQIETELAGINGVLIPGGFDTRGILGKIESAGFAREKQIPFFGICLGMHIAVIEFASRVCNLTNPNSTEFDKDTQNPVIFLMKDQLYIKKYGGTMRLGNYPCHFSDNTKIRDIYQKADVDERHRHRYEFNNDYKEIFKENGFVFSGFSPDGLLVETIELENHPYFIGVQYHPEFKSRPIGSHPLFSSFVDAAKKQKNKKESICQSLKI